MRCVQTLPEGYRELYRVDLQKDKKAARTVNGVALAVMLLMLVAGHLLVPLSTFFTMKDGAGLYWLRLLLMLAGTAAYLVLHELTHALAMKRFGAGRLRFGFTGLYAYAGSEGDYFDKKAYRAIALAPLVVWTLVLTAGLVAVPRAWFWVLYFIQIQNVAGAAGDVYVTLRFAALPESIRVRDTGVEMTVYAPQE